MLDTATLESDSHLDKSGIVGNPVLSVPTIVPHILRSTICQAFGSTHTLQPSADCLIRGVQPPICSKVLDILSLFGLEQQQQCSTWENRILDLFCTNKPGLTKAITTIPGISDHEIICADCDIKAKMHKKPPRKIHTWSRADWSKLRERIVSYRDSFLENCPNRSIKENYKDFQDYIQHIMDAHIPTKMSTTRFNVPWFNGTLKRMCKKKQRLYNKAKKSHNKGDWNQYKSFKRDTLKAVRRQRWKYIQDLLQVGLDRGDTKPFWGYVKAQRQDNMGVSPLKDGGALHPDALSWATILNKQFESVFTREGGFDVPHLHGPDYPNIPGIQVAQEGVEKLLKNLNPKKASGPDQITCRFLRELATEIAPILTEIFCQSLQDGQIPSDWRNADVAPVFKKGNRNLAENYRPVSLTCVCCKLLEHIITSHIRTHLDQHQILSTFQHGFRKFFSCETQLLVTIQDLLSYRDQNVQIDMAVLDRPIRSSLDQEILQQDLTALERWGDTWGMKFNASKCNIMTISRSRSPFIHFYSLCGHILVSVSEAKYLGISLSNELSWSPHVQSLYNKSSSILGFLRRNLRRCPSKLKESAYIALVRSRLEYGAPVWDPHLVKDSKLLEDLQRRAARFVKGDFRSRSSVTSMLWDLGWQDLKHRRRDLRLALLYKIVTGHVEITPQDIGRIKADGRTRAKHRFKFRAMGAKTNAYRHSFAVRTIGDWNSLPSSAVEQKTPAGRFTNMGLSADCLCPKSKSMAGIFSQWHNGFSWQRSHGNCDGPESQLSWHHGYNRHQ